MKKLVLGFLVSFLVIFLIGGCNNPSEDDTYVGGQGNLKVVINWGDFSSSQIQSISYNKNSVQVEYDQITHTGARVVYIDENASFTQSVERKTAEDQGIITFNIPSTDNAKLYTVAVHHSDQYNGNRALWLGVVENLQIPSNGVVEVKMNDINWVKASWYPDKDYENFESGLTAPKEDKYFKIPIYVRDPLQIGKTPSYDKLYVGINGHSSVGENPSGWRLFKIYNENNEINTNHEETYNFQPFVNSSKFNLPSEGSRYFIKPMVEEYTISWE